MVAQFPQGGGTAPLPRVPANPKRTGYVAKALGLVAVAVVSGLIWFLIRHEPPQPQASMPEVRKEFAFTIAEGPVASSRCAAVSTGEVRRWFDSHSCDRLVRALYTAPHGDSKVIVSVAVVTTGGAEQARELKSIVDRDGTGNVNDLLTDGTARIDGAPKKLIGGTYGSKLSGDKVTIVLSEFFDGHAERSDDTAVLERANAEALELADQLG